MEGRILRHQADPKAQLRGAGLVVGKSAIRRMLRRAAAITAAALLLGVLMLVASSVARVGVAPAKASSCRWAHSHPRHVSRKHARHALVCVVNKQRRKHGLHGLNTKHSLRKAGKRHSKYMERHHCFAHQCAGEADLVAQGLAHELPSLQLHLAPGRDPGLGRQGRGDAARDRGRVDAQPRASPHPARPQAQAGRRGPGLGKPCEPGRQRRPPTPRTWATRADRSFG